MGKDRKWIEHLERFMSHNRSAKDYCEAHGLAYATFRRHAKRLHFDIRAKKWPPGQRPASRAQLSSQAPAKHSVYSFVKTGIVPCDGCLWREECEHYTEGESCQVLAEFQSAKMQELMDLPHIKPEDAPMCEMAVREMAIQALIMRFTSKAGMFHTAKGRRARPTACNESVLVFCECAKPDSE